MPGVRILPDAPSFPMMTNKQITALRCAHADLVGALQAHVQMDRLAHDWDAHRLSIEELEEAFPEQIEPYDRDTTDN